MEIPGVLRKHMKHLEYVCGFFKPGNLKNFSGNMFSLKQKFLKYVSAKKNSIHPLRIVFNIHTDTHTRVRKTVQL